MSYFTQVKPFDSQINKTQRITPIGAMTVEETTRLVGAGFGTAVDAQFWTLASSGGAASSGIAAGILTLVSGTAANAYGNATSTRQGRFLFANPNLYRGTVRVTSAAVTGCTRRFGAYTTAANPYNLPTNGFGFEISAAGTLSCKTWSAGAVAKTVDSGSFNGEVASYVVDTNIHAYEIVYDVMGAWYFVDGVLLHKFTPTTAVLTEVLTQPLSAVAFAAAGGGTAGTMELWAASILRYGKDLSRPKTVNITTNTTTACKIGAGTLHRVIITKAGANTNTLAIWDNPVTTGTLLGTITNAIGNVASIEFNVDFYTGLSIVTATSTAGEYVIVYD